MEIRLVPRQQGLVRFVIFFVGGLIAGAGCSLDGNLECGPNQVLDDQNACVCTPNAILTTVEPRQCIVCPPCEFPLGGKCLARLVEKFPGTVGYLAPGDMVPGLKVIPVDGKSAGETGYKLALVAAARTAR